MDPLTYYASHSAVTDPGAMAWWLTGLPADLDGLRRVARQLVIHYRGEDPIGQGIPAERFAEIDTRYAEAMLARLHELAPQPLTAPRPPVRRLVGCCRDFTVLFVTLARHQGIPARSRVGFAGYFVPGYMVDHEVAEVWDAAGERWRLLDPELGDAHTDPNDGVAIDGLDVPRDRFLVGGDAWLACRSGARDPETFVVDPHLPIPETRSWPQLRHNVVQDLAALNKSEMLLWDTWGILHQDAEPADGRSRIDEIAAMATGGVPFDQIRSHYEASPDLRVPNVVRSEDPMGGPARQVRLDQGRLLASPEGIETP